MTPQGDPSGSSGSAEAATAQQPQHEQQQLQQEQQQQQQQQQQPEQEQTPSPVDENPMLQTALTRRFRGRFQPMQMPNYETIMQEDMMNNCGVKSVIAGVMGGLLGVAFGVFTASLDTQVQAHPSGASPYLWYLKPPWVPPPPCSQE
jgi:hypothetical protein